MRCTLCHTSELKHGTLCGDCTLATRDNLTRLPRMWDDLEDYLTPGVRGLTQYGGRASKVEAPLPLDGDVLSLRGPGGIVGVLEDWHAGVRDARALPELPTTGALVRRVHAAAGALVAHIHFIALWEQGPLLALEIHRLVERVRDVLEPGRHDDKPTLLGTCIAVDPSGVVCGAELYADMTRTVQCDWCLCLYPPSQWLQLRALQPGRRATAGLPDPSAPARQTEAIAA
ncbi:hypothetical protein [Streptomyces sp. NPDC055109]